MSHQVKTYSTDEGTVQQIYDRKIEQSGKFSAQSTAEEVAATLATDIVGKTVIITGVSPSGIGAEAARVILKHEPKLLILASRSKRNIEQTIAAFESPGSAVAVKGVEVDLADLDSVRRAAADILDLTPVIDVLINNAGIMSRYLVVAG